MPMVGRGHLGECIPEYGYGVKGIDKLPGVVYDFNIACNSILKGPMIDQAISDVMGTTLVLIFKLFSRTSVF